MKAVILHGAIPDRAPRDELDTLVQVDAVRQALAELGHEVAVMPFSLNLQEAARVLRASSPDFVFNLVESVEGSGRLLHFAPSLLDFLGLPYSGSGAEPMFLTSNKLLTKRMLRAHGIPTPPWHSLDDLEADGPVLESPHIIKSVWEHASVGLDEDSVLMADRRETLRDACLKRSTTPGGECFAEAYIEGREFNISLLAGESGPEVLPPAEIRFVDYGEGKWKVVGYRAKWEEGSFEFAHTPRSFEFPPSDRPLLDALSETALQCWRIFGLRGYARVDFRVDASGALLVLEINANPCLSPDAGFPASASQAGMGLRDVLQRILQDMNTGPAARAERTRAAAPARAITYREEVTEADKTSVRRVLESTSMFYPHEIEVAVQLVEERLHKGLLSGYHFLLAEKGGDLAGYTCFGPIACTSASYDLFWIAVNHKLRGRGLGRVLLERTEAAIARLGGRQVYIETSNRDQYKSTRAFYLKCGYQQEALLNDFYGPGDDKIVYVKRLGGKA